MIWRLNGWALLTNHSNLQDLRAQTILIRLPGSQLIGILKTKPYNVFYQYFLTKF